MSSKNVSTYAEQWFSADDLAALRVPGLPGTGKSIREKAQAEGWRYREVPGRGGRGGVKREYAPSAEVLELVKLRLLAKSFESYRQTVGAGEPLATTKLSFVAEYNNQGPGADYVEGLIEICPEDVEEALRLGGAPVVVAARPASRSESTPRTDGTLSIHDGAVSIDGKRMPWLLAAPVNLVYLMEASWQVRDALSEQSPTADIVERATQAYQVLQVLCGGNWQRYEDAIGDVDVVKAFLDLCQAVQKASSADGKASASD